MLPFLTTVGTYIKKYWQLIALVVGVVVSVFFLKRREQSFADDYKKINEIHSEEIKRIQEAREKERLQLVENQRKLEATLAEIKKKYDEEDRQLDNKKKSEIEKLVKEHSDDPDVLADKLSQATGFRVILPKDP